MHTYCCICSSEPGVAKLLMEAGADVNAKSGKAVTPIIVAAAKGHAEVLKLLAQHPKIELWHQVSTLFISICSTLTHQ